MYERIKNIPVIKFSIVVSLALLLSLMLMVKQKAALGFSFMLMSAAIGWILARHIEMKHFVLFFFFFYSFLPLLWGFQIASFLPVIRAHRVAVMMLLFFLINKGKLISYYKDFFRVNVFSYAILFLGISYFLSAIFSKRVGPSIFYFGSYFVEYVILSVVVFSVFKTKEDIDNLLRIISYAALCLAVIGIYERIVGTNIFSVFGAFRAEVKFLLDAKFRGGSIRIEGPFAHPIAFGAFFSMTLPYFMYTFNKKFLQFGIGLTLILAAILFTQSRSAQIGSIIVLFYYFFFVEKKTLSILLFLAIPLIILYIDRILDVLATLDPTGSSREDLASSSGARLQQLELLIPYIGKRFAIGYGRTGTPALIQQPGRYADSIDNWYLLNTFYYGLVGLATWLFLMLNSLIKPIIVFRGRFLKHELLPYIFISIFVFCVTNTVVALIAFHYIFWINIGILTRLIVNQRNEAHALDSNS